MSPGSARKKQKGSLEARPLQLARFATLSGTRHRPPVRRGARDENVAGHLLHPRAHCRPGYRFGERLWPQSSLSLASETAD